MDGQMGYRKWKPISSYDRMRERQMDREIQLELKVVKGRGSLRAFSAFMFSKWERAD